MRNRTKQLSLAALVLAILAGIAWGECTTNICEPTGWWYYIWTTGDEVYCEGNMHILFTYTEDKAGGIHGKMHYQPQGMAGEVVWGPNLGAKYQGTGVSQNTFALKKGQTETYINNYRCLGQGQAPNLTVHETWHITYNANGVLTAVVDNVKITCD